MFEFDLYVSYAPLDNRSIFRDGEGKIDRLGRALEKAVSKRLSRPVRRWKGRRRRGTDALDAGVIERFRATAVCVVVVTPHYLESERCIREIGAFCDAAEETGGLTVEGHDRVFKMVLTPVDSESALPPAVRKRRGYSEEDIDVLAADVARSLEGLQPRRAAKPSKPAPPLPPPEPEPWDDKSTEERSRPSRSDERYKNDSGGSGAGGSSSWSYGIDFEDATPPRSREDEEKRPSPPSRGGDDPFPPPKRRGDPPQTHEPDDSAGGAKEETAPPAPAAPSAQVDEDVQFTVFRPDVVRTETWNDLLAFAHLADLQPEVEQQAAQVLGEDFGAYQHTTQDSRAAVTRGEVLRFIPTVDGVTFNPPESAFIWLEDIHREDFRFSVSKELDGKTARGLMTVYLGNVVLAEVTLRFRVSNAEAAETSPPPTIAEPARHYRNIFVSYSHKDLEVVKQVEKFVTLMGDRFVRDWTDLRAGQVWSEQLLRLIEEADVFQLFWSSNSMMSEYVKEEWEHALALKRDFFVRPVYWEEQFPENAEKNLPPPDLARIHFQRLDLDLPDRMKEESEGS